MSTHTFWVICDETDAVVARCHSEADARDWVNEYGAGSPYSYVILRKINANRATRVWE
jgi:hypothetical protein